MESWHPLDASPRPLIMTTRHGKAVIWHVRPSLAVCARGDCSHMHGNVDGDRLQADRARAATWRSPQRFTVLNILK